MLANAVDQVQTFNLLHRYRRRASSHIFLQCAISIAARQLASHAVFG